MNQGDTILLSGFIDAISSLFRYKFDFYDPQLPITIENRFFIYVLAEDRRLFVFMTDPSDKEYCPSLAKDFIANYQTTG